MSQLDTKFKMRQPEETIKIIQNFYKSIGCVYKITADNQSEASTWWSHLEIYFNYKQYIHY